MDVPELFTFLENSPRTDYIVTIELDGEFVNELLQYDGEHECWMWSNDWYEGEKDPRWWGIIAIEDVHTYVPDTGNSSYKVR
jgi:hypothetical protein